MHGMNQVNYGYCALNEFRPPPVNQVNNNRRAPSEFRVRQVNQANYSRSALRELWCIIILLGSQVNHVNYGQIIALGPNA